MKDGAVPSGMGVKIRPSGVSIVAAGVCRPDGGLHPLAIEEVSATQVKFSCEFGRSFAHDGWTPSATNTMFRHVAAFSKLLTPSSRPRYFNAYGFSGER